MAKNGKNMLSLCEKKKIHPGYQREYIQKGSEKRVFPDASAATRPMTTP